LTAFRESAHHGMMPEAFFTVRSGCILVRVKAKPGAREDRVLGVRGSELVVAVRVPPEKGKANTEISRVLARALGVPRDEVVLKLGGQSAHKVYTVPLEASAALEKMVPPV
jgi:uncharacterized protein (TIGR00251 family)